MNPTHPFRSARPLVAVVVVLALAACASSGSSSSSPRGPIITSEEVASVSVSSTYELVQRLRPQWLRPRGSFSAVSPEASLPVVYSDGMRLGGLERLRDITPNDVAEVRYLSAADATTRFGTGHAGGVIEVITKR